VPIVIDANIAVAWFRPVASAFADAVLHELSERGAIVPALWRWEVQEVLRRLEGSGNLTITIEAAIGEMTQLPISIDDQLLGLFGDDLSLARKHGLSVYDTAYLELALRHKAPLATLDKKLAAAATGAGAGFSISGPDS
jgi:predicted nucleic acid-binding protein